jgi:hypothetical protein
MKKTIKQIGNSLGIIFNKEECKNYALKKDDIIEMDDTILIKERKGEDDSIYCNFPDEIRKVFEDEAKRKGTSAEEEIKKGWLDYAQKIIKNAAKDKNGN